jgi:hypothetical protein
MAVALLVVPVNEHVPLERSSRFEPHRHVFRVTFDYRFIHYFIINRNGLRLCLKNTIQTTAVTSIPWQLLTICDKLSRSIISREVQLTINFDQFDSFSDHLSCQFWYGGVRRVKFYSLARQG